MYPQSDDLYRLLIKERQADIRRAFERYHLVQAARAAQPHTPLRLAALLQRVRRRTAGAEPLPLRRSEPAGSEERRSA